MQDNKLIAEFMGVSVNIPQYIPNYHTSWDWLMPVLIKIADEVEATHYPLYRSIDEAYNEAVTFIKTFNEEKEKSS